MDVKSIKTKHLSGTETRSNGVIMRPPKFNYSKEELETLLTREGGIAGAAKFLDVTRPTLYAYMRKLGVQTKKELKHGRRAAAGGGEPPEDGGTGGGTYAPTRAGATAVEKAAMKVQLAEELAELTTDEERVLWYAKKGVEPRDIAIILGFGARLASSSDFKTWFEETHQRGLALWRIELAQTIYTEAKLGQVTALREAARAHLESYQDSAPSTEFAGGYKAKVQELMIKIYDKHHAHTRARFKFEPLAGTEPTK